MQFDSSRFSELTVEAARFWEPMRIAYNGLLALLVLVFWGPEILTGRFLDLAAGAIVLLFFAVLANLCYFAAYPVDIAVQLTPLRRYRQTFRWLLLLSGMALAAVLALNVMLVDHMG